MHPNEASLVKLLGFLGRRGSVLVTRLDGGEGDRRSMQPTLRITCCSGRGVASGSVPLVGTASCPGGRVDPCVFLPTQFTAPLLSDRKKDGHLMGNFLSVKFWLSRSPGMIEAVFHSVHINKHFFSQCFKHVFRFPSEC